MNTHFSRNTLAALSLAAIASHAGAATYSITTIWEEPMTAPRDSVFVGSFDFDSATHTISNLQGKLSESMTRTGPNLAYPNDSMVWLNLSHQLVSWYDSSLGGTFAATFKNSNTNTFDNNAAGAADHWSPKVGVDNGGTFYGAAAGTPNPGNAYALIFVPDNPLAALTGAQLSKLAYADCTPTSALGMKFGGGMMGATCMTGTSLSGYGAEGTMSGTPLSQTITASVPEPSSLALSLLGLGAALALARRRQA